MILIQMAKTSQDLKLGKIKKYQVSTVLMRMK